MKRILLVLGVVAVFAGAFFLFTRTRPAATPPPPAVPKADTQAEERRSLFGEQALAPDVQWRTSGLGYKILKEGTAPKPTLGAHAELIYVGRLKDGTVFDQAETPRKVFIGTLIPGFATGVQMLGTGGKAVLYVPPSLAYGGRKVMGIPPQSGLIFEVEVVSVTQP